MEPKSAHENVIVEFWKLQKFFNKGRVFGVTRPHADAMHLCRLAMHSAGPVAQVLGGTLASTALRQMESANKNS